MTVSTGQISAPREARVKANQDSMYQLPISSFRQPP